MTGEESKTVKSRLQGRRGKVDVPVRSLLHLRMPQEDVLDLGRRDVLATLDDRVVAPPGYGDAAAAVNMSVFRVSNHPSASTGEPEPTEAPDTRPPRTFWASLS